MIANQKLLVAASRFRNLWNRETQQKYSVEYFLVYSTEVISLLEEVKKIYDGDVKDAAINLFNILSDLHAVGELTAITNAESISKSPPKSINPTQSSSENNNPPNSQSSSNSTKQEKKGFLGWLAGGDKSADDDSEDSEENNYRGGAR